MLKDFSKKKKIKTMNSKMKTNSQLSTTELLKKQKKKNKLRKQLEQEQNHKNGDHMKGYQQGRGEERMGENIQGIRSINGRYKIDRERLRIVWEMEKPKKLHVPPMNMN